MSVKYEKPAMKRVEIRSEKNVADVCWGLQNGNNADKNWYYDVKGTTGTWVVFSIKGGGSCKNTTVLEYDVLYVEDKENKLTDAEEVAAITEFKAYMDGGLAQEDANGGSPFKGAIFSGTPGRSW